MSDTDNAEPSSDAPEQAAVADAAGGEDETTRGRSRNRRRTLLIIGAVVVVVLAVAAFLVWYFLIRDDAPASVTSDAAAQARQEAIEEAQQRPTTQPDAVADPAGGDPQAGDASSGEGTAADPADPPGLDGTWSVDTSIGTFDEACLTEVCNASFVGFRIKEELASIGANTVVGRTPGVVGTMELEGATITAAELTVDMTGLITDSSGRNNAIRTQAIETNSFPEASFVLTEPIDLGTLPADGEAVEVDATGDLTIHGVTRTESIPLTAELNGDIITVFGELGPILLADYDIDQPRAAVVLSVEDNAIMEIQLFFTR